MSDWGSNPYWPSTDLHEFLFHVVLGGQHDEDCGDLDRHGYVCHRVADAVCFESAHDPEDLDWEGYFEYELFETEQAARRRFSQIKRYLNEEGT